MVFSKKIPRKKEKKIQKILDEYIPDPQPSLDYTNPFTFLIAVVLSAQCTDKAVNKVTPALFSIADTPEKMAQQEEKTIYNIIQSLGLAPTKAKAIHRIGKILYEEYESCVPNTLETLLQLPGVGRKTASVVLQQIFDLPAFPVDTHIYRCARRWGLSKGTTALQVEKDLRKRFPKYTWRKLHLQIILFGRTYCTAKNHQMKSCPICSVLQGKAKPV